MATIDISGLTKDYSHGRGIFQVSFQVEEGECLGFLGPNGAGKSTTIRHLLGFSKPDSGYAHILGKDLSKDRSLFSRIGYLPGEVSLPKALTGKSFLLEQMHIRHIHAIERMARLATFFKLDLSERCGAMSLGSKRKVAILNAFLFSPDILILDEPSSGLDPLMQEKFLAFLAKEKKERNLTMLFSSHIFEEMERVSDRIAVIKDGRIKNILTREELLKGGRKTYLVTLSTQAEFLRMKENPVFKPIEEREGERELLFAPEEEKTKEFLSFLSSFDILDFLPKRETLRDIFLSYYREERTFQGL